MIIDKEDKTLTTIFETTACRDAHVLEIGCGDGRLTRGLAKSTRSLVAIDPDAESVTQAKQFFSGIDFRIGSGEDLEFPDNSFDLVLFTLSLHHQNSRKALDEAARVVLPEGQILVIEPALDSEISTLCNVYKDETNVLLKAASSMDQHACSIALCQEILTEWEFRDDRELLDWLRSFYNVPPDTDREKQFLALLGDKQHSRPLVLSDKLVFTVLRTTK